MNSLLRTAFTAAVFTLGVGAFAQTIYNPTRPVKDQGMSLKSWGSGTIAETDETAFEGTTSIRISSRNYFQGGIMLFGTPVDLSQPYSVKENLLQFTMHVPGMTAGGGGGGKGTGGAKGGGGLGSLGSGDNGDQAGGGKGGAGGGKGSIGASGGGNTAGGGTTVSSTATLEKVRLVVTTSDGMRSEAFMDVKGRVADAKGWMKASIPLQAISGLEKTNKQVTSIALSGDAVSTFYIGEIDVMSDTTPIYGEINQGDLNLALGDIVTFVGNGYAGSTPVVYQWDFDSADGIQTDASGQVIKRKFRKPGDFVVTLTITDAYGLKAPYKTSIKVTVNP